MYLVTSDQMRALDNHTIHAQFVPGIVLMDHAGKTVADTIRELGSKHVVVCTGKGNNGGDGWVTARWCQHFGICVQVVTTVSPDELKGDARVAAQAAVASGVPWVLYEEQHGLPTADLHVDALLGTGGNGPLRGRLKSLVQQLNQTANAVLAIDIPTGVNPDTGEVPGEAVTAKWTVCIAAQKLGTAVSPGCNLAGEIKVVDIGIGVDRLIDTVDEIGLVAQLTTTAMVRDWLPRRVSESHKGSYGRLAVAVGEMQGAAILAAHGAARSGAGLILLMTQEALQVATPAEFVVQRDAGAGDNSPNVQALVLGPGLGARTQDWLDLYNAFSGPRVVDADGLKLLDSSHKCTHPTIVTPHPKECARMLGWSTEEVQAHRLDAARRLSLQTGAIVVLKGNHSLIVHPGGRVHVNPTGDASLATAGTGDVLAGMIGGLLAQSVQPFAAACAGVWLHGLAGQIAGELHTPTSVVATDVVDCISRALRSIST